MDNEIDYQITKNRRKNKRQRDLKYKQEKQQRRNKKKRNGQDY
jgi:hypothetical protein